MDDLLEGCTSISFGPFTAMTAGKKIEDTNTLPVWKVWIDADEKNPTKLAESLTRREALAFAKARAEEWRAAGKPPLVKAGS